VKEQLRARIDAGKMTVDDLGRYKESLGAEFGVSPSTVYNAALELRKELEQKKK
jgi:DNA-binding GntR family transcriptional regulator